MLVKVTLGEGGAVISDSKGAVLSHSAPSDALVARLKGRKVGFFRAYYDAPPANAETDRPQTPILNLDESVADQSW